MIEAGENTEGELGSAEMNPEEKRRRLVRFAQFLRARGLGSIALLFLEMHRPLFGLLEPLGLVLEPMLAPFFGIHFYRELQSILSKRENLEELIDLLSMDAEQFGSAVSLDGGALQ